MSNKETPSDFLRFHISYVVVLEKLSDTCYFLSTEIRFLGVKIAPANWDTKYPFNCFTYNSGIFHNETN